jgi:hypothetical protein
MLSRRYSSGEQSRSTRFSVRIRPNKILSNLPAATTTRPAKQRLVLKHRLKLLHLLFNKIDMLHENWSDGSLMSSCTFFKWFLYRLQPQSSYAEKRQPTDETSSLPLLGTVDQIPLLKQRHMWPVLKTFDQDSDWFSGNAAKWHIISSSTREVQHFNHPKFHKHLEKSVQGALACACTCVIFTGDRKSN